ncbi:MAG: hypothetical protein ACMXYD_01345 [Candidatus Woesearchaeota archaeon]
MNAPELIDNCIYAVPNIHTRVFQNKEYDIYLQNNTSFSKNKQEQIELETILTRMLFPKNYSVTKEVISPVLDDEKPRIRTVQAHKKDYTYNKAALREEIGFLGIINTYEIHLHPETLLTYCCFREEDTIINVAEADINVFTFSKKEPYLQHVRVLYEWQEAQTY